MFIPFTAAEDNKNFFRDVWVYFVIFSPGKRQSCFAMRLGRVGPKDFGDFLAGPRPRQCCNENVSSLLSGFLQLPSEDVQARLNSAEGNYPESCGAGVCSATLPPAGGRILTENQRITLFTSRCGILLMDWVMVR